MRKSRWRNGNQKGALSLGSRWSGLGSGADTGHSVRDKNLVATVVIRLHFHDCHTEGCGVNSLLSWGLAASALSVGKVESEKVPSRCLRVTTTKLWLDLV